MAGRILFMGRYFNPLSLCGERLARFRITFIICVISIHSPSARRDDREGNKMIDEEVFQSTLPLQGETAAIMRKAWQKAFQSTLPLQRETLGAWSHSATARHFNPLPPRRGRPVFFQGEDGRRAFQSTPSSQRETQINYILSHLRRNFNPLPPRRGRR